MKQTGSNDAFVKFSGIQKTYDGETLVVKNLNLDIARGEFLTMLGPSGSGKTTTLMMLAGFEVPTQGSILLEGRSIDGMPPHKRDRGDTPQDLVDGRRDDRPLAPDAASNAFISRMKSIRENLIFEVIQLRLIKLANKRRGTPMQGTSAGQEPAPLSRGARNQADKLAQLEDR
ncbi:MAG: ATP-binding cassette domain-containing protein [Mesorhizobium sp.]|nr:MAG: ATP-binding cassette domain-containing protein [Mesorhizobium sp.]